MSRDRDVDGIPSLLGDAPERGGAAVAEDRFGPGREDRGHPTAELRELRAADGVDAPADGVQPPLRDAVFNRPRMESELEKLPARDHPMLAPREFPRRRVEG